MLKLIMASTIYFVLSALFMFVHGDERTEDSFFVKPGAGTLSVQAELYKKVEENCHLTAALFNWCVAEASQKNYLCKFSYTAQGGTHEEWAISIEILDGGNAVMCTVERGIASYLFFQDFKMELTGPMVSITDVDVKNSQRDGLSLKKDEYALEKNSISSVSGKFKNHLEKVAVYSPLSRDDL